MDKDLTSGLYAINQWHIKKLNSCYRVLDSPLVLVEVVAVAMA